MKQYLLYGSVALAAFFAIVFMVPLRSLVLFSITTQPLLVASVILAQELDPDWSYDSSSQNISNTTSYDRYGGIDTSSFGAHDSFSWTQALGAQNNSWFNTAAERADTFLGGFGVDARTSLWEPSALSLQNSFPLVLPGLGLLSNNETFGPLVPNFMNGSAFSDTSFGFRDDTRLGAAEESNWWSDVRSALFGGGGGDRDFSVNGPKQPPAVELPESERQLPWNTPEESRNAAPPGWFLDESGKIRIIDPLEKTPSGWTIATVRDMERWSNQFSNRYFEDNRGRVITVYPGDLLPPGTREVRVDDVYTQECGPAGCTYRPERAPRTFGTEAALRLQNEPTSLWGDVKSAVSASWDNVKEGIDGLFGFSFDEKKTVPQREVLIVGKNVDFSDKATLEGEDAVVLTSNPNADSSDAVSRWGADGFKLTPVEETDREKRWDEGHSKCGENQECLQRYKECVVMPVDYRLMKKYPRPGSMFTTNGTWEKVYEDHAAYYEGKCKSDLNS